MRSVPPVRKTSPAAWLGLGSLIALLAAGAPPRAEDKGEGGVIDARVQRQQIIAELKLLNQQSRDTQALLREIRDRLGDLSAEKPPRTK